MLPIRKNLILARQMSAARIDQVNAGQVIFGCDGLRAQMFLHRYRVISATFDSRIISNNHALNPIHAADSSNQPRGCNIVVTVHAIGGKLANFEEGRILVDQGLDTISYQ